MEMDLREIYERRARVLNIDENNWAFERLPPMCTLKWQLRLRKLLGLPAQREEIMLEVANAIAANSRGRAHKFLRKHATRIRDTVILAAFTLVLADLLLWNGQGVDAFVSALK